MSAGKKIGVKPGTSVTEFKRRSAGKPESHNYKVVSPEKKCHGY